ncbi:integrase catalytic domain-containing protein [Nephila pilipes]|uniref:Integrase catalytic domain-containing protein n=1 Tax=Nephila pilipes TaxID=299642 RepID=A0A8X6QS71_NEPPI|nr:integrase catalytic domain-containing protein [Nephila pilipes]
MQIRSLESLGVKSDAYSVMLSAIILKLFLTGRYLALEYSKTQISVNFLLSERQSVSAEIRRFWELERLGIRGDEIDSGIDDKKGLKEFNGSVQLVENRYCVKLPWKEDM